MVRVKRPARTELAGDRAPRHARYKVMTGKQIALFVLVTVVTQVISVMLMFNFIVRWYEEH
jgi:hypothetical protein